MVIKEAALTCAAVTNFNVKSLNCSAYVL